jgi:DNA segregation ATPase FtsK/SpoIIIE, S-DNA-T family
MNKVKQFIGKQLAKKELKKAFKNAGLFNKRKNGEHEVKLFPKIQDVTLNQKQQTITYTFTLLNGMDPKEVKKKEYVFLQHFGRSTTIEGDLKKFVVTVYMKDVDGTVEWNYEEIHPIVSPMKLGVICGKDRNGTYHALDIIKQPHILIAGETGSGKSTQLRSILTTFIKTKRPEELELYLGDCKKQEFHIFRKVEHVKCVLSTAKDIRKMLKGLQKEMEERSNLTEVFEVGHIDDLPMEHKRPYIVVCIDEFVMLRNDEEIMEILIEIVAIGRTLGVFAILSMQRPNAKVLDTTVRANLTVSMGFKLRDKIESRIVNTPGAESLEQSGQFIMKSDRTYELQAPFLEMEEAKKELHPFMVSKGDVKEVFSEEKAPETKHLTEKDVFLDVIETTR